MKSRARAQASAARRGWWVASLAPLLLGFGLRLHYALRAEPFVDEPTTLLAAQAIAATGLPVLPSGLFYGNDLPFAYLAGGLAAILGAHLLVVRMLSVVASTVAIGLVYWAGRRLGSPWAGLWAALLLAQSPEAIIWGGRARAYALLGLLAFLAAWLFHTGVAAERKGLRRLGLLLLVMATFVHPEAALLLPAFVVGAWLLKGWRWQLRADRLAELLLAAAGVSVRYWLQVALARGLLSGLQTPVGSRPPLEPTADWPARLHDIAPFFLAPDRLPWTFLAFLTLLVAAGVLVKTPRPTSASSRSLLFFSLCLWLPPLEMAFLLGRTYQSLRYLNLLLPFFALLSGWGLGWLMERLVRWEPLRRWRAALLGLTTAALLAAALPGAAAASNVREKGFRSAFEYVAQRWQPGDRVATVAPAYSQLVLGRCDLFALGLDYEEFVYRADDGRWVDRWLGAPLIRSAEELEAALAEGGRLWFVTDEGRLRRRFDPAFAQTVWARMELVARTDGVLVFVSHEAPPPAVSRPVQAVFGGQVALVGYDLGLLAEQPPEAGWGAVVVRPGQALPLTLYWQAVGPVAAEYTVFVHLLAADGERVAQADGLPLGGRQPMTHWLAGETLPDRWALGLPADLAPGRYRLEVGLYRLDDGERLPITDAAGRPLGQALTLDYVQVPAPDGALPTPAQPVGAEWVGDGARVRLLGYSLAADRAAPGGTLGLTLYWQAATPVDADYTVFVHLLDGEEQIRGQGDGPPVGGFYPTAFWDPGEVVVDERLVSVAADAPPGRYRLAVGLYLHSPQGAADRRLTTGDGDRVWLGEIQVER